VAAFSQLQCIAACLPQEHVASLAQMQPPSRPQQVAGMAAVGSDIAVDDVVVVVAGVDVGAVGGRPKCYWMIVVDEACGWTRWYDEREGSKIGNEEFASLFVLAVESDIDVGI